MNKPIENKQFMEWVDEFVNDTISPEAAKQLLECVQENPERLDELCSQLQVDRLLEIMNKQQQMNSIAETVLKRVEGKTSSNDRKSVNHSKIFLKIAASLAVILGLGTLLMPRMAGRSDKAKEAQRRAAEQATYIEYSDANIPVLGKEARSDAIGLTDGYAHGADMDDVIYPGEPASAPAKPAPKKKWKPTNTEELKIVNSQPAPEPAPEPAPQIEPGLVPLAVEYPKPLFAGKPVSLKAEDLESASPNASYGQAIAGTTSSSTFRSGRSAAGSTVIWSGDSFVPDRGRENYAAIVENEFKRTTDKSLSTFSIDVDTASYANVRRFLTRGSLPPPDAVRIEEMINYFEYNYEGPDSSAPFSTAMALTSCPWNRNHQLLRVGLQGRKIAEEDRKHSNLVFLLDVSGSMNSADKLPLLKRGFEKMVRTLGEKDRVAIVVYAGSSGVVLDSTSAMNKETIIGAMNRLKAGGSTAGGQGIELAYRLATDHFIKDGINRVILATDGDFNVGISNIDALQKLIEEKRNTGVFLSVLGFGTGNLQDAKMEMLANKGNGNYFYIDSDREAEKVLVKNLTANMVTIAKDVKIQVEFNPALVRSYRLIGYENRKLAARDFADDTKDAGEIGAGHQVTALYELVPADAPASEDGVALKYTKPAEPDAGHENSSELLTLKLRYKEPDGAKSKLLTFALDREAYRPDAMDESFRWATSIAAFGMHLRNSDQIGTFTMNNVMELAKSAVGEDEYGYRKEAVELMNRAMHLKPGGASTNGYPQWQYR